MTTDTLDTDPSGQETPQEVAAPAVTAQDEITTASPEDTATEESSGEIPPADAGIDEQDLGATPEPASGNNGQHQTDTATEESSGEIPPADAGIDEQDLGTTPGPASENSGQHQTDTNEVITESISTTESEEQVTTNSVGDEQETTESDEQLTTISLGDEQETTTSVGDEQ